MDILGRVLLRRRVRALGGKVGEARDLERERLAVDDVPVELVELENIVSKRSLRGRQSLLDMSAHLHPAHSVKRALDVFDGEAVGYVGQNSIIQYARGVL